MSGEKLLIGLTCPSCGGQITLEEGEALACCEYCGSFFALDAEEGVGEVTYKCEKTKEQAVASVKEWMRKGGKAKDLATAATISEITMVYLPFWRLIARGKACVCGYNEVQTKDGPERTPYESLINREYVYSNIACDAGDLGIKTIRIPAEAKAVSAETLNVPVFAVTVSKADGYENGYNAIASQAVADGSKHINKVTFSRGFCITKGFNLIYYPFYIVRYEYQGRNYMASVDGITGGIVSGRAPGNSGRQSWFAGLSTIAGAIAGAGMYFGIKLIGEGIFEIGGFLMLACIAVAIALLIFCWKQFRNGGEVITGELKGRAITHGKRVASAQSLSTGKYDYIH